MIDIIERFEQQKTKIKDSTNLNSWVYVFYNRESKKYKIGITTDKPIKRLSKIRNESGCDIDIVFLLELENEIDFCGGGIELFLHTYFKEDRRIGEWFDLSIRKLVMLRCLVWHIHGESITDNLKEHIKINKHIWQ